MVTQTPFCIADLSLGARKQQQLSAPSEKLLAIEDVTERKDVLRKMVLELVAKVCPQEDSPDTSLPLMELGIDSLAGIELGSLLLRQFPEFGLPVPVLLIYELPTVDAIVNRVWKGLSQLAISEFQVPQAPSSLPMSRDDDSRVAVIGLALRCVGPDGDIATPNQLWEVLKKQGCISSRTPKERGWSATASGHISL